MSDDAPEPTSTSDPDEGDRPPAQDPGPLMIGPVLGVMIGYVTFRFLPAGMSIWLRLPIAVVVIALVVYITIEVGRRRARRR